MPSHAIPPGRDGRAHRRVARRRRLLRAWQQLPMLLLWITCIDVALASASSKGSAVSQVLDVVRAVAAGGLVVAVVVVVQLRMHAWRGPPAVPRPRWQYLLTAFGWLSVASSFMLVALRARTGLPAHVSVALGLWSGAYGLVLIGRAVSRGRVRASLWWGPQQS
jgi:hypothetical protein